MINVTREWLEKEAEAVITNTLDDFLFYIQEYGNSFGYLEIAEIFSKTYNKIVTQVTKEIQEENENSFTEED